MIDLFGSVSSFFNIVENDLTSKWLLWPEMLGGTVLIQTWFGRANWFLSTMANSWGFVKLSKSCWMSQPQKMALWAVGFRTRQGSYKMSKMSLSFVRFLLTILCWQDSSYVDGGTRTTNCQPPCSVCQRSIIPFQFATIGCKQQQRGLIGQYLEIFP